MLYHAISLFSILTSLKCIEKAIWRDLQSPSFEQSFFFRLSGPMHLRKATEFSAACAQQSDYYAGNTKKCQGLTRGKCLGYSEDQMFALLSSLNPTWQGSFAATRTSVFSQ